MTTIQPPVSPGDDHVAAPPPLLSTPGIDHLADPPPVLASLGQPDAPTCGAPAAAAEPELDGSAGSTDSIDASDTSLPKLLTWLSSVSRGTASKATALLAAATGLTSGLTQLFTATTWTERIIASATAAGVVASTVLLFLVTARGDKGVVAGHFARAMVVAVTIGYGVITLWAVATNLGADGAWVRILSGLSLVLLISTFALAARSADREPPGAQAAYARAQKVLFFLLGTAVFGAGTALIGRGLHDAHGRLTYDALPPFAEGALVCLLGLALQLSRRAVAAIATIGTGVMIAIFGIASMLKGEMDFGSWTAGVGASTIVVGVAFHGQFAALGKLGFAAGALTSAGVAVYAFETHTMAFCFTMCTVSLLLGVVTVVLSIVPIGVWQFEASDDHRPWSFPWVIAVGASGIVSGTAVGIVAGLLYVNTPATTVAQFAGVSASLMVIGILVIASSRRIGRLPQVEMRP